MNAKEFFLEIRYIDEQINVKLEQLARLEALATKVTAPTSETGSKPSGVSRSMENSVDKIIMLREKLNSDIDRLADRKREAYVILQQMKDEKQRRCLEYRYLLGKTFEEIANQMGYSYYGICKLHGRALQSAEKFLKVDKS